MARIIKKAVSFFLATVITAMVLFAFPIGASAVTATDNWMNTNVDGDTYSIGSVSDLLAFRAENDGGNTFEGKVVKLTADLVMSEVSWSGTGAIFSGTFDGCGYRIINLNAKLTDNQGVLFGFLHNATVKNLRIEGGIIDAEGRNAGTIASGSTGDATRIENIYIKNKMNSTNDNCGAVLGYVECEKLEILNSAVESTIENSKRSIKHMGYSGFIGRFYQGQLKMENCAFFGSVIGLDEIQIGAFVGQCGELGATQAEFINCANMGKSVLSWAETHGSYDWGCLTDEAPMPVVITSENFETLLEEYGDAWTQTGKTKMMPVSVATMLGITYDPNAPEDTEPDDPADIYSIGTPEELLAFRSNIVNGNNFEGKTVQLTADIDMTDVAWRCSTATFSGIFDGNGYAIKNLSGIASENWQGLLFGALDGATVKNLKLIGGTFEGWLSGGVIASSTANNPCSLENLYVDITVIGNSQDNAGLLGRVNVDTVIQNCVVASDIKGTAASNHGGFSGFVARVLAPITFTDCAFIGDIVCDTPKGNASPFVGLAVTSGSELTFTNCFNMGTCTIQQGYYAKFDSAVDTINTQTFNFARYTKYMDTWTQTGEKEMLPTSVAQMLGKSYTPGGSEEQPDYVTPGDKIYNYECVEAPTGVENSTILFDGYINSAKDTWNLDETGLIEDNTDVSLKLELPVPQTHITFGFKVAKAGTYTIAIEYRATHSADYQHVMQFSIDQLGKEELYLQYADGYYWLLVEQELEAGDHTFTVYAPDNRFEVLENGKIIQFCNVRNFKVYQPIPVDGLSVVDGAAVKLDSKTGILRYTARIDKELYEMLIATYGEKNVSFGMIFGSSADAAALGTLTKEAFNQEAYKYYDDNKPELFEDENGYYFYGYWTADSIEEYDDMMSAAAYVRIKLDGRSKYIYTAYNAENDRSIALVASRAAADTKNVSENGYNNAITVNGATVYSPYTENEYANLVALAAYNKED